jgi:hypothetical protein
MLTTVQTYVNELTSYQVPAEQRAKLGGKGPAMKLLASKIKELWPTLNQDDKALFVGAISRGRFAIAPEIWNLFLDAVGSAAPASTPATAPAAPQTNKVAAELLEISKVTQVTVNLQAKAIESLLLLVEKQAERQEYLTVDMAKALQAIDFLQQHVKELKKTLTRRGAKAKVEDTLDLQPV